MKRPHFKDPADAARWFLKNKTRESGECLEWSGHLTHDGYGSAKFRGKRQHAHRFIFAALVEEPDVVRHRCDNRKCVRLDHLENGTNDDNMRDMVERGRSPRGERACHAKLTESQVVDIREAYRSGARTVELARENKLSRMALQAILSGKTWKHAGGPIGLRKKRVMRLSAADAAEARRLYRSGGHSYASIASKFSVCTMTAYNAINRIGGY